MLALGIEPRSSGSAAHALYPLTLSLQPQNTNFEITNIHSGDRERQVDLGEYKASLVYIEKKKASKAGWKEEKKEKAHVMFIYKRPFTESLRSAASLLVKRRGWCLIREAGSKLGKSATF